MSDRIPREPRRDGEPIYLPSAYDPSRHAVSELHVKWQAPLTLRAGDAVYIPEGWWHCISSEAGGVAVAIEPKKDRLAGGEPQLLPNMGSRHRSGRSEREVSRRARWASAKSVLDLWESAIEAHDLAHDLAHDSRNPCE